MKKAEMSEPGWVQRKLSGEYVLQALRVAKQLRDTADRIERSAGAIPTETSTGLPDHNRAAVDVLAAIDTFHGNLSTSALFTAAAAADRHARDPKDLT